MNSMQRGDFTSIFVDVDDDEYINDSEVSDELYRSFDAFSSDEDAAADFYREMEHEIVSDNEMSFNVIPSASPKHSINSASRPPDEK